MIVVRVGDLVVPLTCKRCGYRVPVIVGDEASEAAGCVAMSAHDKTCDGKERKE